MSLIYYDNNRKFGTSCIWKIEEQRSFFFDELGIREEEIPHTQDFRKDEWLSIRYLAKRIDHIKYHDIIKDQYGKPHIQNRNKHISISHSDGIVCYSTADQPIGVDFQVQRSTIVKIAHKYTSDAEISLYPSFLNRKEKLHLIWTLKEAVFKLYGKKELPFIEGIQIKKVHAQEHQLDINGLIIKPNEKYKFRCISRVLDLAYFSQVIYDS